MTIVSTKRVFITADHKSLVGPEDPKAAFLFAVPGQRVDVDKLKELENAEEFFSDAISNDIAKLKEAAANLGTSKRVAPEPAEPHGKHPKVKHPEHHKGSKDD